MIEDELNMNVDDVPDLQDPFEIIRRPDILFTNGYLNNPITFNPDPRYFYPLDINVVENIPPSYTRDIAQFLIVEVNSRDEIKKYMTTALRTPRYTRAKFERTFKTEFTELV